MTEGRQKENTSPLQAGIAPEASFITLRSIAIGAVLSFFLNFLDVYATTMIRGAYLTLNFSTPAALFFFFFVVLANGLVALIRRPLALTQAEQITIYILLIIACCIPWYGVHAVHDSLLGGVHLLRHAGKRLGRVLQSTHQRMDDPARRKRRAVLL